MNFINLATVDNLSEAESLSLRLSDHGIPTRVHDERNMQRFLFLTKPKGYSYVQVQEQDYARAAALIQEWEAESPTFATHIFSCPECGSFAVEYPQFTRKAFIVPLVLEWLSNIGLYEKQFYCRKCHATWPPRQPSSAPAAGMPASVLVPPPD
ncbi:MAG: DUF2007 domain-containing protein [Prosthecobacter sp.]|nr:DUF2007 domain-containing protein [Prosthecobacter sp.]